MKPAPKLHWSEILQIAASARVGAEDAETKLAAKAARDYILSHFIAAFRMALTPVETAYKGAEGFFKKPLGQQILIAQGVAGKNIMDAITWSISALTASMLHQEHPKLTELLLAVVGVKAISRLPIRFAQTAFLDAVEQADYHKREHSDLETKLTDLFMHGNTPMAKEDIQKALLEDTAIRREIKKAATHPKFDLKRFISNETIAADIRYLVQNEIETRKLVPTKTAAYKADEAKQEKRKQLAAAVLQLDKLRIARERGEVRDRSVMI